MPINQPTPSNNNGSSQEVSRPFVTTDNIGRRVTINVNSDTLNSSTHDNNNNNQETLSDFSFDEEDDDDESINDFRLRYLNLRGENEASNNFTRRQLHRPYLNPNNNFMNHSQRNYQNNNYRNERFQQAMVTPLPPPPPPPNRRGAFNSEIPNSYDSSTLSLNRDTGDVSLATYTNNSINLNNSILRRVMQPSGISSGINYNHHQQISPSVANSNESHIRQDLSNGTNANTFSFLNDINRLSTQSLYNDLTLRPSNNNTPSTAAIPGQQIPGNYIFNHSDHSFGFGKTFHNINKDLNEIYMKRRQMGKLYNKHLKFKSQYPKKRDANELDDTNAITNQPYHSYHFDIIRVTFCSFIRSGSVYAVNEIKPNQIPFTISFISVNYETKKVAGCLSFEHLYLMKHWLTENAPDNAFINLSGNNTIKFTGEMIDFETSDLRFSSYSLENFNNSLSDDFQNHSKNFRLIYNNCITKKQLSRWKKLKPFQNLGVKEMIPILTCNECLLKLQENFLLIKIYIDCGDETEVSPTILLSVDRKSGELQLIPAEGKATSMAEQYANHHHNHHHNHQRDDKCLAKEDNVTVMSMKCKKFVSPSLKFC